MKKTYYITSAGYEAPYPTFEKLGEARKYLAEIKAESKQRCKELFKQARVKNHPNGFEIYVGCMRFSSSNIHTVE
jgi:hypothetical protein